MVASIGVLLASVETMFLAVLGVRYWECPAKLRACWPPKGKH